jgi:hypothetical protein
MPLTSRGRKVLASMRRQYGSEKGERVFYASINKKKAGSSRWHSKRKKKHGSYSKGVVNRALAKHTP